ncbi:MAG TPA: M1 family metallopeptidase [Flavisolibacter sp.]|nr:M1 family metallopeptidase [Flavisolibacter sp.]
MSFAVHAQIDVQHYKYEIELNDKSDGITGKAFITVKFMEDASQVQFDLASLEEDKGMYAFQVKEGAQLLTSSHRKDIVYITLLKPAQAGHTRTFEISYMGVPKDGLIISKNKYGDRTFFADNWPDRARHWVPCKDDPSDKATVEFIVIAPAHYRVVSNGLLLEEKQVSNDSKRTHWKEEMPVPTKVMVIGAARFAVARVDSNYRIPVTAWVYPQDSVKGFFDYALADDILQFFEAYIGPYPYKKLANVQSTTMFGGMENANAIFYDEKSVTGTRKSEALVAHEIIHQWFGNTATEKHFSHLWLSEGFATYLTHIYMEHRYGLDSFQKRLKQDRREIIQFTQQNPKPVIDSTSELMDLLNANSYQKGGWFLHMLRQETGDSSFKKIIQAYYDKYKGSNAETRDFRQVAEMVTGKSLDVFFDQWLYQGGVAKLNGRWTAKTSNQVEINIQQQSKTVYLQLLEIGITYKDGSSEVRQLQLSKAAEAFLLNVKEKPVKIELDPNTKILFEGTITQQ